MTDSRRLPEDIEAEAAVLATLAGPGSLAPGSADPNCTEALLMLQPEHLMVPAHRLVLQALKALYARAEEVDALSLKAELEDRGHLSRVGGYAGLVEILSANELGRPQILAARLVDLWRKRELVRIGSETAREGASFESEVGEVLAKAQEALSALLARGRRTQATSALSILDRIQSGEAFRRAGEAGAKLAWLGFPEIDREIEAAPGHIVIVGARPGCGKTALALQALAISAKQGVPGLMLSLELDEDEVDARLAAWITGEGQRDFRAGTWSDAASLDLLREQERLSLIHKLTLRAGTPLDQVEAGIRDAVRAHGVRLVALDYFTLVQKPATSRGGTDASAWAFLSQRLRGLAQELRFCLLLVCQLNREGDGGEPSLRDLRETGQLEQDANAVVFLYPQDPKAMDKPEPNKRVMLKLAKCRSGASGWKRALDFHGPSGRMVQPERQTTTAEHAGRRIQVGEAS